MSKHDYQNETVIAISESIAACQSMIENSHFPIEDMSYSWDLGVIHNVVTWIEVMQINGIKSALQEYFADAVQRFSEVYSEILDADRSAATALEQPVHSLKDILKRLSDLDISAYGDISASAQLALTNGPTVTRQNSGLNYNSKMRYPQTKSNKALNRKYQITTRDGKRWETTAAGFLLMVFSAYRNDILDLDEDKLTKLIESGKLEVYEDKIYIVNTTDKKIYIKLGNTLSANFSKEYTDFVKSISEIDIQGILKDNQWTLDKDGNLQYSSTKKIDQYTELEISASMDLHTGEVKFEYTWKVKEEKDRAAHSISLVMECHSVESMRAVPAASEVYQPEPLTPQNAWRKAYSCARSIMQEFIMNANAGLEDIYDILVEYLQQDVKNIREAFGNISFSEEDLQAAIAAGDILAIALILYELLAQFSQLVMV